MSYKQIVVSISAELQRRYSGLPGSDASEANGLADEFMLRQKGMPDYLRLPVSLLTRLFDYWGLVSAGKRFTRQSTEQQQMQFDAWKNSRLEACRSFIRFYEGLFLLVVLQEDQE